MRHTALALLALAAAGLASSAVAADLSGPMAPPMMPTMAPAAYDWTGAYMGVQLGYGFGHSAVGETSFYDDPTDPPAGTLDPFSFNSNGIIGGAEVGANWQSNGVVWGLEADISASDIKGTYTNTDPGADFSVDSSLKWLSTARVKIGLPMNNMLIYATGGVAVGGVQADLHDNYPDALPDPVTFDRTSSSTAWGWTAGGGIAAAVNEHWIIKAEALYVDLGSVNTSFEEDDPPGWALISGSAKTTATIIRAGIDYRF